MTARPPSLNCAGRSRSGVAAEPGGTGSVHAGVRRRLLLLTLLLPAPALAAGQRRRALPLPLPPPPPPPPLPDIDAPPSASGRPGLQPAPVPSRNLAPPRSETEPHPRMYLGVPEQPDPSQGLNVTRNSNPVDAAIARESRFPAPGVSIRLPFR